MSFSAAGFILYLFGDCFLNRLTPPFFSVIFRFDFPGRITSEIGPNGNKVAKLYTHLNADGSRSESNNSSNVQVES